MVVLIGHLERNLPHGEVWKNLTEHGVTEDQLRKVWKKKAFYYMGKAHLKLGNYAEAIKAFDLALALIVDDASLMANANELRGLLADTKARWTKERQREKNTWAKAFEKRKMEPDAAEDAAVSPNTSLPSTPVRTGVSSAVPFDPKDLKFDLGLGKESSSGNSSKQKKASSGSAAGTNTVSTWLMPYHFSTLWLWGVFGASVLGMGWWAYIRNKPR